MGMRRLRAAYPADDGRGTLLRHDSQIGNRGGLGAEVADAHLHYGGEVRVDRGQQPGDERSRAGISEGAYGGVSTEGVTPG